MTADISSDTAYVAARGTSLLLTQAVVSGVLRVLTLSILTRYLSQTAMGQIAILGIVYGFMQFLGALGLNHASPLVIPEEEKKGTLGKVKSFLRRSIVIILVSSSVMAFTVFLLQPILFGPVLIDADLILIALAIAPFSALEVFIDSFLLGRYQLRGLFTGRLMFEISRAGASIYLAVIVGMDVRGVIIGWLLAEIVAVLAFGLAAIRPLSMKSLPIRMSPILAFALPNLAFQIIDVTIQNTDRIFLGILTDLATLGVYDVFLRVLFMLSLVSLTISTSLYPILTRVRVQLEEGRNYEEMGNVVAILVRYVLLILLPISIIVALNSRAVLMILFGTPYADFPNASLSFSLLVLAYALWGVVYAIHTILRSLGEAKFFIIVGFGVIVFEIVGCWYLTALFGILGTSIIRVAYIVLLFVSSVGRLRQLGVRGFEGAANSISKILFLSTLCGVIVFLVSPTGLVEIVLWVSLAGIFYILLLFVVREVTELDFRVARAILPDGLVSRIENYYFKR